MTLSPPLVSDLRPPHPLSFRTCDDVRDELKELCRQCGAIAEYRQIGSSVGGRPIDAVTMGTGEQTVSLIAGAHSDEPVGPETLRIFVTELMKRYREFELLLQKYRFYVIPHINPDGEDVNQKWIREWPSLNAYLRHAFRELPGQDLEFGYPDMRPENKAISTYLTQGAPFSLHMSLHGMAFSEGAFLLIERHWIHRTGWLQEQFVDYAKSIGLALHDHDRNGEKGFLYGGPGITSTPEGSAMRDYFLSLGDQDTATRFHDSSMEFVRSLGGDPLCLVTELPLFDIGLKPDPQSPGKPVHYLAFQARKEQIQAALAAGKSIAGLIAPFNIRPLPLETAVRFQLYIIQLGLETLERGTDATT